MKLNCLSSERRTDRPPPENEKSAQAGEQGGDPSAAVSESSVSRASANQIDSAVVPFRPTEDRKGNRRTIYCLFFFLKPSKASRAPHRSLFEGKWRKMSKKWERREGEEGRSESGTFAASPRKENYRIWANTYFMSRKCVWRRWRVLALSS